MDVVHKLAKIMGHKKIQTTIDYIHIYEERNMLDIFGSFDFDFTAPVTVDMPGNSCNTVTIENYSSLLYSIRKYKGK